MRRRRQGYDGNVAVTTEPKLDAHRLRADFAVFDELVNGKPVAFLDSAASTQKPRQVLDAMRDFYEHSYANVHRGVYRLAERATTGYETARGKVAGFVNAPSEREVIFTRSATEALNLVAYAWGLDNLGPGDLVVVTDLEHHSSFVPWQYVAGRTGAAFKAIPIDESGELRLDALDEIEREGTVKVVASNLVSNTLGTVNPVQELAAWAHERGAIMVVDAAQAAPHRPIDVQALDCEFLAISSHKMCGPSGIGALWGRRELLETMAPFNLGGEMIRSVSMERTTWNELPYKFEAGTPAIAEAVGLRRGGRLRARRRPRAHRGTRARPRRVHARPTRRASVDLDLRAVSRAPRRHRLPERRRRPSARRGAGARLGGSRRSRGPPLHAAAHGEARRRRDGSRELLPVLDPGRGRPPRRRAPQGQEEPRLAVSEFDQLYRELILDHYKNPRNHGLLDPADAQAEGQNPLCGDEISVSVRLDDAGVIEEVGFDGRGCAISQAATSMLSDLVKGRTAEEVAAMPKEELLDELGIPLTPVRLKCAILGLGVLKLALHKARGTPLPEEWGTSSNELVLE